MVRIKNFQWIVLVIILGFACPIRGQDTIFVSLTDVVKIARDQSLSTRVAEKTLSNNYWYYQAQLANFNPQIGLEATLGDFNRSIQSITLPDGAETFVHRKFMRNTISLGIQQDIAFTGGSIYAGTGLQRIDQFDNNNSQESKSYLSTPVWVSLSQPLFRFNRLKWNKRMASIYYKEAQSEFAEDLEDVSFIAASLFFDLLTIQINLKAARQNLEEANSLLKLSQGKFDVGQVAETEVLQMKLNVMNARALLSQNRQHLHTTTEALRNYIGLSQKVFFKLQVPEQIPDFLVDAETALEYARQNRSEMISFERRQLEAVRNLEEAKADNGPNASLNVSFGLSQVASVFRDAYTSPLDNERFSIGLNIPIADWGKARSQIEIAQSNKELVDLKIQQDRISFTHHVSIKVQQFELVRDQVVIAVEAYSISQQRLEMTRARYRIGRAAITDLNLALSEEANARKTYISAVRAYWLAYYELRRMTLYDFEKNEPLK